MKISISLEETGGCSPEDNSGSLQVDDILRIL